MAAGEFHTGDDADFEFNIDGNNLTLACRGWTLPITGMTKAVHNSRDGRKRIPGLIDVAGATANLVYDGGVYQPRPNDVATAKLYTSKTNNEFYSLEIIVDTVGPACDFEGELVYPITFSLESGTLTYPAYT